MPKHGLGLQFCETQESSLAQEPFVWAHGLITLGIPKPANMMKSDIPFGGPAVEAGGMDEAET